LQVSLGAVRVVSTFTSMNAPSVRHIHFRRKAYQNQESVFAAPFELISTSIAARAFPGASIAIVHGGNLVALKAFGGFTYDPNSSRVLSSSIFDIASVSKVIATTTMAMILYERGLLDIETSVAAILPDFSGNDSRRRDVTVRMLLSHSSGLPGYEKLFLRASTRDELLSFAMRSSLLSDPGARTEYSDIGFIILGAVLEHIADETLNRFCQREVFGKLGMTRTMFTPPTQLRDFIPPTAFDEHFRHKVIQGEVQDENACVLGGVAGHAGVFSSAEDLAIFANNMLETESRLVRPDTVKLFTQRESLPVGTSRALGWDSPSSPSQSGKSFSSKSFGHLGYTGTSLWIDSERQLAIILLTNRTWPDCANQQIKQVRPAFHDAVAEALHLEAAS
jgi:CubicO group peptidase (beta-lactamase class C family)